MAARHAGFGAAASITEETVNEVVAAYWQEWVPRYQALPLSIPIWPTAVQLSGLVVTFPPRVELHANPNNQIQIHFEFRSVLRAGLAGQPKQKWRVRFRGTIAVVVLAVVQDGQIRAGIDLSNTSIQKLELDVLSGPPMPSTVKLALKSPVLASSITAFIPGLPVIPLSPPLLRNKISFTQGIDLKWLKDPSWFTVTLNVSAIIIRPLENALTVAVEFDGANNGNPAKLVDLTSVPGAGSTYSYKITPESDGNFVPDIVKKKVGDKVVDEFVYVDLGPPRLTRHLHPKGGDIAFAINLTVLNSIVAKQIEPQVWDAMIYPDITLKDLGPVLPMPIFKELVGVDDGFGVGFHVTVEKGPYFGVDGVVYLQAYYQYAVGPNDFQDSIQDGWRIYTPKVDIDLPFWVDVAVVVLAFSFGVAYPVAASVFAVAGGALIGGVLPSIESNIETQAALGIASGENAVSVGGPWSLPVPGLAEPWSAGLDYLSFSVEGIDAALGVSPPPAAPSQTPATITPSVWAAGFKTPIKTAVKISDELAQFGVENLRVSWVVRRGDTNEVIAKETKSYANPNGNGVTIDHHTPELYHVDSFLVRCTILLSLNGQIGAIWSGKHVIEAKDSLDRHHKFVEWGPYVVSFLAPSGEERWLRKRKSKLHRTAVSARCRALHEGAWNPHLGADFKSLTYSDSLPFAWSTLDDHRDALCEYCFFGGPDKHIPFPAEDWF